MEALKKPTEQAYWIGRFRIVPIDDKVVWIGDGTGEGGTFNLGKVEATLAEALEKFYAENF